MSNDYEAINEAIMNYVRNNGSDGVFVTGWVASVSMSSPFTDTGENDSYLTIASDGLPYHTQIGLLEVASNDAKNMGFLASIGSTLGNLGLAFGSDDEDDD